MKIKQALIIAALMLVATSITEPVNGAEITVTDEDILAFIPEDAVMSDDEVFKLAQGMTILQAISFSPLWSQIARRVVREYVPERFWTAQLNCPCKSQDSVGLGCPCPNQELTISDTGRVGIGPIHEGPLSIYPSLGRPVMINKAAAEELAKALEQLLECMSLSTEMPITNALYRTPAVKLREEAENMEKQDRAINSARNTLQEWKNRHD